MKRFLYSFKQNITQKLQQSIYKKNSSTIICFFINYRKRYSDFPALQTPLQAWPSMYRMQRSAEPNVRNQRRPLDTRHAPWNRLTNTAVTRFIQLLSLPSIDSRLAVPIKYVPL